MESFSFFLLCSLLCYASHVDVVYLPPSNPLEVQVLSTLMSSTGSEYFLYKLSWIEHDCVKGWVCKNHEAVGGLFFFFFCFLIYLYQFCWFFKQYFVVLWTLFFSAMSSCCCLLGKSCLTVLSQIICTESQMMGDFKYFPGVSEFLGVGMDIWSWHFLG